MNKEQLLTWFEKNGHYSGGYVRDKIRHLDEPEPEQDIDAAHDLLQENTTLSKGDFDLYWNCINDGVAVSELKQEKVAIPQFVAREIERYDNMLDMLSGEYFSSTFEEIDDDSLMLWIDENQEKFARAWIDGYTVEKEKLYRVRLPITVWDEESSELQEHWYYLVYDNTSDETRLIQSLRAYEHYQAELSETLIKSIDERFWAFAVEVTE